MRERAWPAVIALGAALTVVVLLASVAFGARPRARSNYSGKTAQDRRISLRVNGQRNIQSLDVAVATSCGPRLGSLVLDESDFGVAVHRRDGSFSDTYFDASAGDFDFAGRTLLQVAEHEITGKFTTPRKVVGSVRVRSAFYYADSYPENSDPVDKCDTGVVKWTARIRR